VVGPAPKLRNSRVEPAYGQQEVETNNPTAFPLLLHSTYILNLGMLFESLSECSVAQEDGEACDDLDFFAASPKPVQ
jgi:hypothetical protein